MISFALAANTPYLLIDEPTNGLIFHQKVFLRKVMASSIQEERIVIILRIKSRFA
jgi:ABC-2 type transport system ATP-binding protein